MEFDIMTNEKLIEAVEIISDNFGVKNLEVFKPPSRKRKYVDARRALIYFLGEMGMSYTDVGLMLGVNHSTAIYHRKKFVDLATFGLNKDVKGYLDSLLTGIKPTNEDLVERIIRCIFITDFGMVNKEKTRKNLENLLR